VSEADSRRALEVLEGAGATVRPVPDVAALRRAAAMLGPAALVVADLRTGAAALRASLQRLARQDAVVVLADTITEEARIALLRDGADHVADREAPAVVVANVVDRSSPFNAPPAPQGARQAGDIAVDVLQRTAHVRGRQLRLTPREFDLLAYFITNPGTVLGRDRLLADVWGYDVGDRDTVTVHIRRLRRKLEPDPTSPAYLLTIWGFGYKLGPMVLP